MQDRIPLYPGRVKMTPVAGQANTYDMVRADDPTQAGTPLNKASLLKDATAALYGLGTDAVPDDVFQKISKFDTLKVGDVLSTTRSLGDNWLLCNGDLIDDPEINSQLGSISVSLPPVDKSIFASDTNDCVKGFYLNGKWYAISKTGSSSRYMQFLYADEVLGDWTDGGRITSTSSSGNFYITYYNGTLAVLYTIYSNSKPAVAVSQYPFTQWSDTVISTSSNPGYGIFAYNGTWVVAQNGARVLVADDPTGTWTSYDLPNRDVAANAHSVYCHNGTWIVGGSNGYIWTTTDPRGDWVVQRVTEEKYSFTHVGYLNGKLVLIGASQAGSTSYPAVFISDSANGPWVKFKVIDNAVSSSFSLTSVGYVSGKWVLPITDSTGYAKIYNTVDENSDWQVVSSKNQFCVGSISNDNDKYVLFGYYSGKNAAVVTNEQVYLPTISIGVNSFIKVKE